MVEMMVDGTAEQLAHQLVELKAEKWASYLVESTADLKVLMMVLHLAD